MSHNLKPRPESLRSEPVTAKPLLPRSPPRASRWFPRAWILALSGVPIAALQPAAAQSTWGPRWTLESGAEGWIPRAVSLGNRGTQALTQFGPFSDYTRLFSASDTPQSPPAPTPVWQRTEPVTTYNHRVASAEYADVHATLHDTPFGTQGQRAVVLRRYASSSSTPIWSYTFPVLTNGNSSIGVKVSRSGDRIVAVVHNSATGQAQVAVFSPDSDLPTLVLPVQVYGPFRALRLSADGRTLYLSSSSAIRLVDTTTGAPLHLEVLFEPVYEGHAVSADGSVFAYGTQSAIRVFRRNTSGLYTQVFSRTQPAGYYGSAVDISDNGATLAGAFNETGQFLTVRLETYDLPQSLAQGQAVVRMSRNITGGGSYQNTAARLETSADGALVALGLSGDQAGLVPEVQVYSRDNPTPLYAQNLAGSVQELELSADGRALLVGSRLQHNNVLGSGGKITLHDLSAGDLDLIGIPRLGSTIQLRLNGNPGSAATLFTHDEIAPTPQTFPGLGTLYLRRVGIVPIAMGSIGANGSASMNLYLDPASFAVGDTFYVQGLISTPRHLTLDWTQITIVP